MAEMLRRGLADDGHAVDLASDGAEALWLAREVRYDAIVLDLMLPDTDGLEVCRTLRARDDWTPILVLTARSAVDQRVAGLDAGADDFLAKPFSFLELSARLRALSRRSGPPRPTVLAVRDLRLDPAAKRAWRGEVELALSPTEFALLELFLKHPGKALSRAEILDAIWDFAFDSRSNVVDQYVGYLRRKVDRPFGREDIETVRGVGYRLRADD
jgi:two-component system OmpR family response regulator